MTRALLLAFSPHGKAAENFRLAGAVVRQRLPGAQVQERDYGSQPLPPLTREYANALTGGPDDGATDLSEQLIVELEHSDLLVLCTPIHNFTVPAALKAWIDHVVRVHRSFTFNAQFEKVGLFNDRKTVVLVSCGNSRKGYEPDFLTPYLTAILKMVGIVSVQFVYLPAMVRGEEAVNQALEQARGQLHEAFSTGL
ncbi:MAG: FMN-dependent NADH-azoreductase [Pseudomonas sp.]|nr:MAG: FMN-dependent NADH-azoreductase [Pseudomonas sp.]